MKFNNLVNIECEYFPCHKLNNWFSCLFCYCPLYLLNCPGKFVHIGKVKDCSNCTLPHEEYGWDIIQEELRKQIFS